MYYRDQGGLGNWGQVTKLLADDPAQQDVFGWGVTVSGDTTLVTAFRDDVACSAGLPNCDSGSGYVFEQNEGGAGAWGQVQKITASDVTDLDFFGHFIDFDGVNAIVGAPVDWDNDRNRQGAAYIFCRQNCE